MLNWFDTLCRDVNLDLQGLSSTYTSAGARDRGYGGRGNPAPTVRYAPGSVRYGAMVILMIPLWMLAWGNRACSA